MIYISIIIILILLTMGVAGLSFAPWVPARKKDVARIFALSDLKSNEVFYDLGCGDGRMIFFAAKNYGAKAIGLEIGLPLYAFCRLKQMFGEKTNAIIKFKNLFKENLGEADVVYFFGMPEKIKNKLAEKLKKEMKSGSRIISYAFHVPGLSPFAVDKPTKDEISIYLYRM
ncbi:class I SAM-dependent methyltransferase [Patescibacteria group bacterium]|nr:class I SAM-dependent methyltransferase [Patescibacteria group bacterium]MBU1613303.1 class I SAM-dependent methyltransferase [Patescibacteria group bacterium]